VGYFSQIRIFGVSSEKGKAVKHVAFQVRFLHENKENNRHFNVCHSTDYKN
jgi:hypothetical protein